MKICLTLLSVGMIAAAATAADRNYDVLDYTGSGLMQQSTKNIGFGNQESRDLLYSTAFDAYVTGAVCTDLTGASMGQDSWWQYQTGSGNRWGVVTVTGGKALKGTWGTAAAAGSYSYLWQDNAGSGYSGFTTGRSVELNFNLQRFSNTVSTNKGQTQLRTYDASGTQTSCGFIFNNYATGTNPSIRGLAYLNTGTAATSGTYAFTLATGSAVTQAGTHSYYTAYNNQTGVVYWGWDTGLTSETNYFFDPTASGFIGAANQAGVNEIDFLNNRNSSTTAGNMNLDNIAFYAYDGLNTNDCNGNGVQDWMDIAYGTSRDCNNNQIPDSCDISKGAVDLNHDGVLDICQGLSENDTTTSSLGIPTANTSVNTTFTGLTTPLPDATLILRAKGDLDGGLAGLEYLNLKINNEANWQRLFETDGVNCSSSTNGGESSATITIPLATFAQYAATGTMKVTLLPALSVTSGECANGFMTVELKYVSLNAGGDCDNDAQWDTSQISANPSLDRNNNGHLDFCDIRDNPALDRNNNGVLDSWEISQNASLDRNNNGQLDSWEISQNAALDRNNNGILDSWEISQNTSLDRNKNGVLDSWEISQNAGLDRNNNGILDSWDISQDASLDRNLNGVLDTWEISQNAALDRNNNGVLDSWDISQDASLDRNLNGVLDSWEISQNAALDRNNNGVLDSWEISQDASLDRNLNGVLDSWECLQDPSLDLNNNGILDSWEIVDYPSLDRNKNGLLDSWEIAQNPLLDRNTNGVLDSYDCIQNPALDCNTNYLIDQYEIIDNPGIDCNENNVIDTCDIHGGAIDDNGDGRLDTCQRAKGDLDLNGDVDTGDVSIVLLYYGEVNSPFGDFDGNQIIDTGDVSWLLLNFGPVTWP